MKWVNFDIFIGLPKKNTKDYRLETLRGQFSNNKVSQWQIKHLYRLQNDFLRTFGLKIIDIHVYAPKSLQVTSITFLKKAFTSASYEIRDPSIETFQKKLVL